MNIFQVKKNFFGVSNYLFYLHIFIFSLFHALDQVEQLSLKSNQHFLSLILLSIHMQVKINILFIYLILLFYNIVFVIVVVSGKDSVPPAPQRNAALTSWKTDLSPRWAEVTFQQTVNFQFKK